MVDTLMQNADDILKQLEEEAAKEQGDEQGEGLEQPAAKKPEENEVEESEEVEEPAEEEPDEEDPTAKKRGNAFAKMRHENKQLSEQLEAMRKEQQDYRERFAKLEGRTEALTKPEEKRVEDAEPDKLMYPEDWSEWKIRQLEGTVKQISKTADEAKQYQQYQSELRGIGILDAEYKKANPKADFEGAVNFLMEKERAAQKVMNPNMTDAQINAKIEAEKVGLYRTLVGTGRNPSEVLYNLAKTHGFTESAPKKTTDLATVEKNQRRATNLIGGSPASKDNGKVSTEDVLNMSFQNLLRGSRKPGFFDSTDEQ